ncbi:MAG: RnfH family protein [Pseudomonadales bacterium]|nr:RnfH family protein [Pseudomonadales bacterium]
MLESIAIEVAFISIDKQVIKSLDVPNGTTVIGAIRLSGIKDEFPELDLNTQKIGIYGRLVKEDDVLQAEDRVEIYRALIIDPKEARRRRAEKKLGKGTT